MRDIHEYNLVPFDIETSNGRGDGSLNERDGFIALMQIKRSPKHEGELLDVMDPEKVKGIYQEVRDIVSDDSNLIIGHNLKFDYKWLAYNGIFVRNVFDTMVASQILYAGIHTPDEATQRFERSKKVYQDTDFEPIFAGMDSLIDFKQTKASRFSHSFAACMERELGRHISKAEQRSDWARRPLSQEQIDYALSDVIWTDELALALYKKLVHNGLEEVFWLEMEVIHALAYKEMVGIKVDKDAWKEKSDQLTREADSEQTVLQKELGTTLGEASQNHGLFGIVPVTVNLNSPKMAEFLELPNVQMQTLLDNEEKDPFISKFIKWKSKKKLASTYGKTYLDKIGADGRLRGEFSQAFTSTGRLSSKNPNLQNVPDYLIKSMIRPSEGMTSIAIDFSTVELRILAYMSGDPKFVAACNSKDMHSENARTIFDIPEGADVPKQLRKKAKVVSFAVPYGTSAYGLFARGLTDSLEEAQELIDKFYNTFPTVATFLRKNADMASNLGYTRDAIGRIRNYELPTKPNNYDKKSKIYKDTRTSVYQTGLDFREIIDMEYDDAVAKYKDEYDMKALIGTRRDFGHCKEVNSYDKQLAAIRREGQNHPIQATSASITKRALADTYQYLMRTGYGYLTLSIHDSIIFELKTKYISTAIRDIKHIMEAAGPKIFPTIITPVEIDAGKLVELTVLDENNKEKTGYVFTQRVTDDFQLVTKTNLEMLEELRAA